MESTKCLICGKPLRRLRDSRMVHLSTDSIAYAEDFSYRVRPSKDQGWFEVGADCYRKVADAGRNGLAL